MISYLKRAVENMAGNPFLTVTTLFTITLSVLIAGSLFLFFENISRMTGDWNQGVRVMAYLDPEFVLKDLSRVTADLKKMDGVRNIRFISREAALESLEQDLESSGVVLSDLRENPLPHALEILLSPSLGTPGQVEAFAAAAEEKLHVQEVVYGHRWVEAFLPMLTILKMGAAGVGTLFVITALFVSANTVRLAFFAKHEEIEIMRPCGSHRRVCQYAFLPGGNYPGGAGRLLRHGVLFVLFRWVRGGIPPEMDLISMAEVQFLSPVMVGGIMAASIFLGWLGCFISLKQS